MTTSLGPTLTKKAAWLGCLLLGGCFPAFATVLSYTGALDPDNPNDVFLTSFTLDAPADVLIQTWGFGGTAAAPSGTNGAGAVIAAGGFDPYVSLFSGAGATALFIASNDDGLCPSGTPAPTCADSTLAVAKLAAGTYTLALTLPFNFPFAENLGTGSLGDGFIGLDSSFNDGSCARNCSNQFAVDIGWMPDSRPAVPEPASAGLALVGLALIAAKFHNPARKST